MVVVLHDELARLELDEEAASVVAALFDVLEFILLDPIDPVDAAQARIRRAVLPVPDADSLPFHAAVVEGEKIEGVLAVFPAAGERGVAGEGIARLMQPDLGLVLAAARCPSADEDPRAAGLEAEMPDRFSGPRKCGELPTRRVPDAFQGDGIFLR